MNDDNYASGPYYFLPYSGGISDDDPKDQSGGTSTDAKGNTIIGTENNYVTKIDAYGNCSFTVPSNDLSTVNAAASHYVFYATAHLNTVKNNKEATLNVQAYTDGLDGNSSNVSDNSIIVR